MSCMNCNGNDTENINTNNNGGAECSRFFPRTVRGVLARLVCECVVLQYVNGTKERVRIECITDDLVVVRENTEDLYAGIERQVSEDAAESIKIITRDASTRIAKYAFDYAVKYGRKTVHAVTKANICKLSDGLFLECAREVAKSYPQIEFKEILVDNLCMQLVQNPQKFDVLVLPNLYGDIVSDLTAGLIGGLGVAQGANIGLDCAVFEPVHGSAPDIKGQNKANPTALLFCAINMLHHIGENMAADKIDTAMRKVIAEGKVLTADLGGNSSTTEYTEEIIKNL